MTSDVEEETFVLLCAADSTHVSGIRFEHMHPQIRLPGELPCCSQSRRPRPHNKNINSTVVHDWSVQKIVFDRKMLSLSGSQPGDVLHAGSKILAAMQEIMPPGRGVEIRFSD